MKYKLTKYDVLKLYPEMTPYEIKEEFGERCPSVKQMYNMTKSFTNRSSAEVRRERLVRWQRNRPMQMTEAEVKKVVDEYSDLIKKKDIEDIWVSIKEFEERF